MTPTGSLARSRSRLGAPPFDQESFHRLALLDAQIDELYELMPFGSYCTDSTGTILSINDAALALLGRQREHLVGDVVPNDCFAHRSLHHFSEIVYSSKGNFDECRLTLLKRDGSSHHVAVSGWRISQASDVTRSYRYMFSGPTEISQTKVLRSGKAVDVLCAHIAKDCSRHMSTSQMAALTGMTSRALSYAFRRRFGCTPIEWQRAHFLDLADQYLRRENVSASVKSIARRFGFSSSASFSKFYRKRFGRSPDGTPSS